MPRKRSLRDDDKGRAAKCLRGLGIPQRQIAKVLHISKENPAAAEEVGTAASTRRDLQWEVVHSCGHMLVSENIGLPTVPNLYGGILIHAYCLSSSWRTALPLPM